MANRDNWLVNAVSEWPNCIGIRPRGKLIIKCGGEYADDNVLLSSELSLDS